MSVAFVIAHKYYISYKSYLKMYLDKIKELYDCDVYVVDNNSADLTPLISLFTGNVHLLINDSDSKFELGAYKFAINNIPEYDYVVFTQDTFILKNRFEFKTATLVNFPWDRGHADIYEGVLFNNGLNHGSYGCWCNSFILAKNDVKKFMGFNLPTITTRKESAASERYMGRILLELGAIESIDGDVSARGQCIDCDPTQDTNFCFAKKCQQKNERT